MCPNRWSREACDLEYEAARLFETTASKGVLLELFDKAVAEHTGRNQLRSSQVRQAALAGTLSELEEERRGYLRQNARGVVSDADLDVMLAEVETRREAVASEMRRAEDAAAKARSIQATRYLLFHEEWYEDPDSLNPWDWPLHIAREEELRTAYIRYGALRGG